MEDSFFLAWGLDGVLVSCVSHTCQLRALLPHRTPASRLQVGAGSSGASPGGWACSACPAGLGVGGGGQKREWGGAHLCVGAGLGVWGYRSWVCACSLAVCVWWGHRSWYGFCGAWGPHSRIPWT